MKLGKKTVMVSNPWGKRVEENYDFDVTKSDKLFDFLLERGLIKLPANHVMVPPNQLKHKKFYKFHNANSHSTNKCRIFQQHIQWAIQQGKLFTPKFGRRARELACFQDHANQGVD